MRDPDYTFTIERNKRKRTATVKFAKDCIAEDMQNRGNPFDPADLLALLEVCDTIILDFSNCYMVLSNWYRSLETFLKEAKTRGVEIEIKEISEFILKTADILGMKELITQFPHTTTSGKDYEDYKDPEPKPEPKVPPGPRFIVLHPPDCKWHQDWHTCNCGAFEINDHVDVELSRTLKKFRLSS